MRDDALSGGFTDAPVEAARAFRAALEAMAAGCPVITSDRSSLPEVGGDAVIYVDPEKVTSIAEAMRQFIDSHHMLIEGAAGVALSGLKVRADQHAGENVVVIICGGNISRDRLKEVI